MVKHEFHTCFTILNLKLPAIPIVLLSVDVPARSILSVLKSGSFSSRNHAIRLRPRFQSAGPRLLSFHSRRFAPGKRTASHALMNAPLLAMLASICAWRCLSKSGDGESEYECDQQENIQGPLHSFLLAVRDVEIPRATIREAFEMVKRETKVRALSFRVGVTLRNAILTIVLLSIDRATFTIHFALKPCAFTRAYSAAGHSSIPLVCSYPRHSLFEPNGFAAGQFAAADSLIDSLLFAVLAVIYSARARYCDCAHAKYEYCGDEQAC